jgi:hypothetical protein
MRNRLAAWGRGNFNHWRHVLTIKNRAAARTRARLPRAARARTATPRRRRARTQRGPGPPCTSRGCARRIARAARGSALRCENAYEAKRVKECITHGLRQTPPAHAHRHAAAQSRVASDESAIKDHFVVVNKAPHPMPFRGHHACSNVQRLGHTHTRCLPRARARST